MEGVDKDRNISVTETGRPNDEDSRHNNHKMMKEKSVAGFGAQTDLDLGVNTVE